MYRFQVRQRSKGTRNDTEHGSFRETNGNINAVEALALASEGKGQLNGIIANVIHESLEHTESATPTPTATATTTTTTPSETLTRLNGIENRGFVQDTLDGKVKDT